MQQARGAYWLVMSLFLVAAPVAAQVQPQGTMVRVGPVFEQYNFSDEEAAGIRSLSVFSIPFVAAVPVGGRVLMEVRGAFAHGAMDQVGGETIAFSGLTDTEFRVGMRTAGSTVAQVQGIAILPTGSASHGPDEALLAGAMAADLLPFRVSNWGSGGGFGAHTSVARSFGDTGAGVSVSYVVGREFQPLEGEPFAYRPGNQLRVRAALDHNMGPSSKVTLTLTMEQFSEDVLDGTNLYRAGNRLHAISSYAFQATPRSAALVYGGVMHRSQGTALLEAAPSAPSQQLLLAGGGIRLPMGPLVLVPGVDARVFRSADGVGQGWLTGVGAAAEFRAAGQVLAPSVRARFGNVLIREGQESGVTGLELALTSRFGR